GRDHAWAYWARTPTPFDALAHRVWHRLLIATPGTRHVLPLGPYRYQVIRGGDFYQFIHAQLAARPNIEFLHGRVDRITDGGAGATLPAAGCSTAASVWPTSSPIPAATAISPCSSAAGKSRPPPRASTRRPPPFSTSVRRSRARCASFMYCPTRPNRPWWSMWS